MPADWAERRPATGYFLSRWRLLVRLFQKSLKIKAEKLALDEPRNINSRQDMSPGNSSTQAPAPGEPDDQEFDQKINNNTRAATLRDNSTHEPAPMLTRGFRLRVSTHVLMIGRPRAQGRSARVTARGRSLARCQGAGAAAMSWVARPSFR